MTFRVFRVESRLSAILYLLTSLFLLSATQGCAVLGVAAHAVPVTIKPAYTGLKGQSVAVMVWADRSIRIDFPKVSLDLSNYVQTTLAKSVGLDETKEILTGTTFPYEPRSVVRFQQDHPEIQSQQVTEFAPRLGVTRLIYIEIEQLQTR